MSCNADRRAVAAVLVAALTGVLLAGTAGAEEPKHFRWVGQAGDGLWSSPTNWEAGSDGETWAAARTSPGAASRVHLGRTPTADAARRTIRLDRDTTIAGLLVDGDTPGPWVLTTVPVAADAKAPVLFMSESDSVELSAGTRAALRLDVEVRVQNARGGRIRVHSEHGAGLVIEKPFTVEGESTLNGQLYINGGGEAVAGMVVLRAPLTCTRLYLDGHAGLFADPIQPTGDGEVINPGSLIQVSRGFWARRGTILIRRDMQVISEITPYQGETRYRLHEAGDADVTIEMRGLGRGGAVYFDAPTAGSTGQLTAMIHGVVQVGSLPPPVVHLAPRIRLDLGVNQDPPLYSSQPSGIHGQGALVKSRIRGRGQSVARVSTIADHNTYTGGTFIELGTVRLVSNDLPENESEGAPRRTHVGQLGPGMLYVAPAGVFDLNGHPQTVAGLADTTGSMMWPKAQVRLNGGTLTIDSQGNSSYSGTIAGPGTLIKQGTGALTLASDLSMTEDTVLRVAAGTLAVTGSLVMEAGRLEIAGGQLKADSLDMPGRTLHVTLSAKPADSPKAPLVHVGKANLGDAKLTLSPGTGDPPRPGTTWKLLETSGRLAGVTTNALLGHRDGDVISVGAFRVRVNLVHAESGYVITLTVVE